MIDFLQVPGRNRLRDRRRSHLLLASLCGLVLSSSTPCTAQTPIILEDPDPVPYNFLGDSLAFAGGTLAVQGAQGNVYLFDATTGQLLHTFTDPQATNKTLLPDGLQKIALKAGGAGHGKITLKGKGQHLGLPTLPLATQVRAQLVRRDTGACWEAVYSTALAHTTTRFAAKSD